MVNSFFPAIIRLISLISLHFSFSFKFVTIEIRKDSYDHVLKLVYSSRLQFYPLRDAVKRYTGNNITKRYMETVSFAKGGKCLYICNFTPFLNLSQTAASDSRERDGGKART